MHRDIVSLHAAEGSDKDAAEGVTDSDEYSDESDSEAHYAELDEEEEGFSDTEGEMDDESDGEIVSTELQNMAGDDVEDDSDDGEMMDSEDEDEDELEGNVIRQSLAGGHLEEDSDDGQMMDSDSEDMDSSDMGSLGEVEPNALEMYDPEDDLEDSEGSEDSDVMAYADQLDGAADPEVRWTRQLKEGLG